MKHANPRPRVNGEISPRVPTSDTAHWRGNQCMPLLTGANETCRDILFVITPEYRRIMFEDHSEMRADGQAFIIQSENGAGDSVSADKPHVTVNRKEHS